MRIAVFGGALMLAGLVMLGFFAPVEPVAIVGGFTAEAGLGLFSAGLLGTFALGAFASARL